MGAKRAVQTGTDRGGAPEAAPPATEGATERVARVISEGIRAGVFVPGQHLLEPELTRRLSISRGSLREALKHLAAAGIVTLNRYRGAYISALDKKSVLDLLETLEPLARLAARLAAEHCDTGDKKQMMKSVATAIEAAGMGPNNVRYLELRRRFYSVMVDIGGNRELARTMPLARTDLFRAQIERIQSENQRQRHATGYGRIARAIIEQDAAAADTAVKQHFKGTRKTIDELPDDAFPQFGDE